MGDLKSSIILCNQDKLIEAPYGKNSQCPFFFFANFWLLPPSPSGNGEV